MFCKRRWSLPTISIIVIFYVFIFWLLMQDKENEKHTEWYLPKYIQRHHAILKNRSSEMRKLLHNFDKNADVLVFFHIQKTGGTTFNTNLVNLNITPPCECSGHPDEGACRCRDDQGYAWMFSRFTTSSSCGVHPPLVELQRCAPKFLSEADGYEKQQTRRFLYATILRDPITRYLSEWHHVQKVGHWPSACQHGDTVKKCIKDHSLSLDDFINCAGNPANNRQTHMLVSDENHQCDDLDLPVNAQSLSDAKNVLRGLSFFGLTEQQLKTKQLFEKQFGVGYYVQASYVQSNADNILETIDNHTLERIQMMNNLDIELYNYAKHLFQERLQIFHL